GPQAAIVRHFFIPAHFWQYVALALGFGPDGSRVTLGGFLRDLVLTQVWLAVPVGLLAASLAVYAAERAAAGAEWDPSARRRQVVPQRAQRPRGARLTPP